MKCIPPTTNAPATIPTNTASGVLITSAPAVIATRPARAPLSVMAISGFFFHAQLMHIAETAPAAADRLVLQNTLPTSDTVSPVNGRTELPLKPNQPNHRINIPSTESGMLCPGIFFDFPLLEYFPIRGPSIHAPANAAAPPTICTTVEKVKQVLPFRGTLQWTAVEPAKSWKPSCASQPSPHIQCPDIG